MIESAEMIMGRQENVHAITLTTEANLDLLRGQIEQVAEIADVGQGLLVLVDMFGGTPANAVASNLRSHDYRCLCGVNLPMLLEAFAQRNQMPLAELAAHVEDIACQSVVNLNVALERALRGDLPKMRKQ